MTVRATSHTRLRARDHYTSSTLIGGNGGASPRSSFTLRLREQRSMRLQDGCKVYMDSYMAAKGSCFKVTWFNFKNHLLKVGLTQNRGDHGTPNAHNNWFTLFYYVWRPAWIEILWNSSWSRVQSHMTSHYTWGSMTTLHEFGGVLGRPLDTFFWALTVSWSQLLARV